MGEGAASIALSEGIPTFRASAKVIKRIEALLNKVKADKLTPDEEQ